MDGYRADPAVYGWSVCAEHGGRMQCPMTHPQMCDTKVCGGNDYCCALHCFLGRATCDGFEAPPVTPRPPQPDPIDISNVAHPHLHFQMPHSWIQCLDNTIVDFLSLLQEDRQVCVESGIAVCPLDRPILCEAHEYQTALPIYRSHRHCDSVASACPRVGCEA